MNDEQQAELRALREEQRTLTTRLRALDERLARFERQAADEVGAAQLSAPIASAKLELIPTDTPLLPPPLPPAASPVLSFPVASSHAPAPPRRAVAMAALQKAPATDDPSLASQPPSPSDTPVPPSATREKESLEVRIGSRWLLYGGVVLLLTALAFLGSYLYQNIVPHLGPAAKVALLYLGAGGLAGGAALLERSRPARANPRLHTYAQTLLAAGLAGVYYVTYAAHYFERLRVIESSLVAGAALLAWTAFMVCVAHRRNSETIATVGILLAYYTSAINEGVATFTLFSNLALTGGVVFLLRRHLWRVFPFASLLATFGSYAFWTYYYSVLGWRGELGTLLVHAQHASGGFWVECAFLAIYWALFTWAACTAGEEKLPALRRAGFVSLNNGAFYGLVTWLVLGEGSGGFWKWSLGFGVVLLLLAETCRRLPRPADPPTENAYLLQGVLLATTGLVAYFGGWQLGLVLAMETVTLLAGAGRRRSRLLLGCSMLVALGSCLWMLRGFSELPTVGGWAPPLGVGAFLVGAAYLAQRLRERTRPEDLATPFARDLVSIPACDALLGCIVWLVLILDRAPGPVAMVALYAGAALVLTGFVYALRVRTLPLYAQGFLATGSVVWLVHAGLPSGFSAHLPGWVTLWLLVSALGLGHWWQRLPGGTGWTPGALSKTLNAADAVLVVAVTLLWFEAEVWTSGRTPGLNVAEAAGLSLGILGYAFWTRYRALAVASQGLLLASVVFFFGLVNLGWGGGFTEPVFAAAPLLAILITLVLPHLPVPVPLRGRGIKAATLGYEILATLLLLRWARHYLPHETLLPVYTLAGGLLLVLGLTKGVRRWLVFSAILNAAGGWSFFLAPADRQAASWLSLLGAVVLAVEQQVGRRRLGERPPAWFPRWAQGTLMTGAVLCAWTFVTTRVELWRDTSITLAAGWSVFAAAVFAAGWFLRERTYRWLALGVLAVTLGHIVWFDLTRLDSLGKAISFFALAVVALVLGFLYTRFQDKFRDLL